MTRDVEQTKTSDANIKKKRGTTNAKGNKERNIMKLFLKKRNKRQKRIRGRCRPPLPAGRCGGISFRTKVLLWLKKTELLKSANISSPENHHHHNTSSAARVERAPPHRRIDRNKTKIWWKSQNSTKCLKSRPPPENYRKFEKIVT